MPYTISNFSERIYTTEAAVVENITRYIPEDEETLGGTPIPIKYGLKMVPPPRPRAPATKPPKNPKIKSFLRSDPSKARSLLAMLMLSYFLLRPYSYAMFFTEMYTPIPIRIKNTTIVIQSAAEHLSKTIFLQIFIAILMAKHVKFMSCFFQIK